MDDDPMAGALLTAFNALLEVAPPGRSVPVLRHALVELLDEPPIPATIEERPRPSRNRHASQPGLEAWLPLRDRVLAELAARGTSRRELAHELKIAPGKLAPVLLPRCRPPSKNNRTKIKRWLERRPTAAIGVQDAITAPASAPLFEPGAGFREDLRSDGPKRNGAAALPAYRLSTTQREKLAGIRSLDERSLRKSAGVALETVDAAIAGGRDLAPEIVNRLALFLDQQQPAAE